MNKEKELNMWLNILINTNVVFIDEENTIKYGNVKSVIDKEIYEKLKSIKNPSF